MEQAPKAAGSVARGGVVPLAAGGILVFAVFALGLAARLPAVVGADLGLLQFLAAHVRAPARTELVAGLADSAVPSRAGLAAMVVVPVAFLVARRRHAAVRAFGVIGGAMMAATLVKHLLAEPRPPVALWVGPAEGFSFPSGHTTVAAAVVVAVLLGVAGFWRVLAGVVGAAWVLGVAFSRLYLAHHYLHDVLGAVLLVAATGFVAVAVGAAVRPRD